MLAPLWCPLTHHDPCCLLSESARRSLVGLNKPRWGNACVLPARPLRRTSTSRISRATVSGSATCAESKVLLSFFRDAGCPFCNLRVYELSTEYEKLRARGVEVIAFMASKASQMPTMRAISGIALATTGDGYNHCALPPCSPHALLDPAATPAACEGSRSRRRRDSHHRRAHQ
ncbi:MAG: redoxin domain-containing protein [Rhodanobacter sp.]|nr:MAG: redoxin domain-containing protein [Rhodanobacter sp.]